MKDNRLGAIALIVGSVSGIITMSLHPTGGGHHVTTAQFEKLIGLIIGVHALALAGLPLCFCGALVLSRRLDSPSRLSFLGLVIYGFGLVALMAAATMSGLVAPPILREIVAQTPASEQWRILLEYTLAINQGFAQIGAVSSSFAIVLWSLVMVRRQATLLGLYGLFLGLAIIVALVSGLLKLGVHGFGLIIFSEAIWFLGAAALLWRSPASYSGANPSPES